jgi:hypothetical protein
MKRVSILIFLLIIIQSCGTWRHDLIAHGDYNEAVKNAILDFSKTSSLVNDDNAFFIFVEDINDEIVGISISGSTSKFLVTADGKSDVNNMFPTRYLEKNSKLFYWDDSKVPLSLEILSKLDEYGQIDSLESIAFATLIIDDGKEGINYYFCKNNLLKYKKMKSTKSLSIYNLPLLNCIEE